MSVVHGEIIKLENREPEVTRLIPPPKKEGNAFLAFLLNFAAPVIGALLVPLVGPESLGGVIALEGLSTGLDIGLQYAAAEVGGTEIDPFLIGFSLLGNAGAAVSTVKAASTVAKAAETTTEVAQAAQELGLSSLQVQQIAENAGKVVTEKLSANNVSQELIRAGLTQEETLKQLESIAEIARKNGLNVGRFNNEIEFAKQETQIFEELNQAARSFGFELNDVFEVLADSGIDVVGVRSTNDLAKVIKQTEEVAANLKGADLFTKLEGALQRDLEPSIFTRVLNAKNAEQAFQKVNKVLSLANPNTLITELTNKIFDPLKDKLYSKAFEPVKDKVEQKLKHLLRQDLARKQQTKNGVYPAFGSSWINYIRAIPLGGSQYKAGVVFRKWGYKQVVITPTLSLQFIIGWSESSSPGRIYHKFRKEYGGPKGVFTEGDAAVGFQTNVAEVFNLLGYIPDTYISLGVSLVGNIANTAAVVSTNAWQDFFEQPARYLERPLEDKGLEIIGGQAAKAVRDQAAGNGNAVRDYYKGKIQETAEQRDTAYRASSKSGRGKLDAVRGISGIIK